LHDIVSHSNMQGRGIIGRVNRDRADAEPTGRSRNAYRDLASVRNEE
jgi:hypothetical protein